MSKITYADKITGGTFTAADANEIKTVVNANEIKKSVVEISSAQILDLHNTPVELIAAPGNGKFLNIISCQVLYKFGTIAYNNNNNEIYISTLNNACFGIVSESSTTLILNSPQVAPLPNEPLGLFSIVPNTNGDGTLKIITFYTIEDY